MEFFHVSSAVTPHRAVSFNASKCLGTGRPPTGRSSYVDTELPEDVVQTDTHGQSLKGCECQSTTHNIPITKPTSSYSVEA
jgi:hypothetical protein